VIYQTIAQINACGLGKKMIKELIYLFWLQKYLEKLDPKDFINLLKAIQSRWEFILSKRPLNEWQLMKFAREVGIKAIITTRLIEAKGYLLYLDRLKKKINLNFCSTREELTVKPEVRKTIFTPNVGGLGAYIILDDRLPKNQKLFAIGHELGHWLAGHLEVEDKALCSSCEFHADIFAMWLIYKLGMQPFITYSKQYWKDLIKIWEGLEKILRVLPGERFDTGRPGSPFVRVWN